jgi:hypothetical protein
LLKLLHQPRHLRGGNEHELTFADIHTAITPQRKPLLRPLYRFTESAAYRFWK